jgi:dipicolinate synthase subunit A
MSVERWLIIGTDLRIKKSAELLKSPNREIVYEPVDVWDKKIEAVCKTIKPHCIIFPIQPLDVSVSEVNKDCFQENTVLFFGRMSPKWDDVITQYELKTLHYLQDEQFIWQNARLTAEGFIAAFYEKNKLSISGRTFHVTGFGRVAKMLANMLQSMGAKVFIFVRSEKIVCEAKAFGYQAAILTPNEFKRETIHYLLNTIPAKWFTNEYVIEGNDEMFLFDLASAPGCLAEFDQVLEGYELLPGLPGQYFASDAALLLSETVIKLYNLEKEQQNA